MNRRAFLETIAAAGTLAAQTDGEWGAPVVDIHLHPHAEEGVAFAHIQGSGVQKAVLLTNVKNAAWAKAEITAHPGRFIWFASADARQPECMDQLRQALDSGARGVGEMKTPIPADSREMRRIYDLCAERKVPVLLHFQEVPSQPGGTGFNMGFRQFDRMLKAHAKTTFIGHADFFWASVSAEVPMDTSYPPGKVKVGGLTDRWLAEYPNLYGDLSANSANNALSRDPEFARGFLARHQNKLMFGCDCSCRDGHGTGGSPLLPRLKGKCVARDTLGLLKELTSPDAFRKIVATNAKKVMGV